MGKYLFKVNHKKWTESIDLAQLSLLLTFNKYFVVGHNDVLNECT